ncbi:MAG: D-alanyl-D-alanine carboxypeptidase family protein [Firmicutes bacterium]|nr:D-alanyl-D-alanine carboxypeptidase family protein [Bacillota bacterium]
MNYKNLKKYIYIVLSILVLILYTKDIDFSGKSHYKEITVINEPDIKSVLVNKNYKLPIEYVPNDLTLISNLYAYENKYLRKEAKDAFEQLSRDASTLGYKIIAVSAYRDYYYQDQLYNNYIKEKGSQYADKCSARPGHSEHQTGLAVDVMGSNNDYDHFENSLEFEWMKNNAHHYGFILRYPENKTKITGFKYEPWHYRYVGITIANIIYQENITLEEYYDKYINLN